MFLDNSWTSHWFHSFLVMYDEVNDDDLLSSVNSFNELVNMFTDEVVHTADSKY